MDSNTIMIILDYNSSMIYNELDELDTCQVNCPVSLDMTPSPPLGGVSSRVKS